MVRLVPRTKPARHQPNRRLSRLLSWQVHTPLQNTHGRLSKNRSHMRVPRYCPAALLICLNMVLLAVRLYRTWKPMCFFVGFFFVALLPTSNLAFLIGSIMAERFVYLPSIGLAGCVIAAGCALKGQLFDRKLFGIGAAWIALDLLCVTCSVRTYARNSDWVDELSLWKSTVDVSPESAKVFRRSTSAVGRSQLPEVTVLR
jgi:small basic protein